MKTIWKKILPWYFEAVRNGSKTFEIRKDEDGFEVGDHIILCEWSGTAYTGFTLEAEVTYILRDAEQYGLMPGFCILGIKALDGKDTNVPANSALDHIHNVVRDDAYRRGYEQGKKDAAPKWTPVSKKIPEEGHDVLITKEPFKIKGYEREVIKAKRSVDPRSGKIEWWSPEFGTLTDKAVLAWMSLPEPWK